jgi:cytochrome c556
MTVRSLAALMFAAAAVPSPAPGQAEPAAGFAGLRQGGFIMSSLVMEAMKQEIASGREARSETYTASGLQRWAHALPLAFPAGSGEGEGGGYTQPRPAIWRDRAGFEKAAANYAAAADRLVTLARANDTPGFRAQLRTVSATCDACHAVYKDGPGGR